jgi:hypothetical protein
MAVLTVGPAATDTPTQLLPLAEYDLLLQVNQPFIGTVRAGFKVPGVKVNVKNATVAGKTTWATVSGSSKIAIVAGKATWATVVGAEEPVL